MTGKPAEVEQVHTRLLKCALEVEAARAYWAQPGPAESAEQAFESYLFGAKSLARVKVLLTNLRARFDAFPEALPVLRRWSMTPSTRTLICHWHLQLSDPLYRAFTGTYLPQRREALRSEITRDLVIHWVEDQGPGRWTASTRIQFASKLLSCSFSAGLVASNRDPRRPIWPTVENQALEYLVYLLRGITVQGSSLDNPYFASVGLAGSDLQDRLRQLPSLRYSRQGDVVDFGWQHDSLSGWASNLTETRLEGIA